MRPIFVRILVAMFISLDCEQLYVVTFPLTVATVVCMTFVIEMATTNIKMPNSSKAMIHLKMNEKNQIYLAKIF